jgi:ABC-type transporter Mla subunit MlaD
VTVGHVKSLELAPDNRNATRATIEIDPEYAPISSDAQAILRQKTLLGETFIELVPGTETEETDSEAGDATAQSGEVDVQEIIGGAEPIEEGGHLEDTQVTEQTQIDEIFNALDEETRQAFQLWMKNAAIAVDGRGLDLNDAFGNIGPFASDASEVLETLRSQERALRSVVRNTGEVFEALTARDQELAGAIVGSNRTFRALASRDEALAETFQIFPTFQRESRLTLERLEAFAINTDPLFQDLKPVARDLSPTLRDLRGLAPHARRLFKNLRPLIKASRTGLPALRDFLDELRPVMVALDPFLANFNPVVDYLSFHRKQVTDFLATPGFGHGGVLEPKRPGDPAPRHTLRIMSHLSTESLSIWENRLSTNRGNAYFPPIIPDAESARRKIFPNWDCLPPNGFDRNRATEPVERSAGPPATVACFVRPNNQGINWPGKQGRFIHVGPNSYR